MKINKKKLILIVIIVIVVIFLIIKFNRKKGDLGYFICNDLMTGAIGRQVLNNRKFFLNKKNWLIYIPCGYTKCELEIQKVNVTNKNQKLFMIDGCDQLCSKFRLWDILESFYGDEASSILPKSFLSFKKKDLERFWEYYDKKIKENPYSKFIFKNNQQRQEGISLIRDKQKILKLLNKGHYVMQEYLPNPLTIIGHKINLRYYILYVVHKDRKVAYMHYNGFVYYTANKYSEKSIEFHSNITSGYVDRKIYEDNPLTLIDFYKHLNDNNYDFNKYIKNLIQVFVKVFDASHNLLGMNPKFKNNTRFQLFGCDIAPSEDLNVHLMEFNKGPDLSPKGPRDYRVKYKVFDDIINLILDKDHSKNQFMKIWEKKL